VGHTEGFVRRTSVAAALVAVTVVAGCSSPDASEQRATRGSDAVEACRDRGGVSAFDDDTVVCQDGTANDERGERAVAACRDHDGVSAFDDDLVICRDQTFHEAAEG
jgi:hypothetical protein